MKEFNWYAYAADKKDLRKVLQGIYCHKGKFVVSDSHIIIGKNFPYPEKYEGKIVKPDGTFVMNTESGYPVEAKYPRYEDILTSFRKRTEKVEKILINFNRFNEISKEIGPKKSDKERYFISVGGVYYKYTLLKLYIDFCKFCGVDYIVQDTSKMSGGFEREDCFCQIMPSIVPDGYADIKIL